MTSNSKQHAQPYAVIGAGDLVSHIQRSSNANAGHVYSFNLFRLSQNSEVTHSLRPEDLRDVVKACQVLAFTIVDDGWLTGDLKLELQDLFSELDAVTQTWSNSDEE